ncbi:TonB-dependent siderophore receptor [Frateuria aurantia]
MLERVKVTADEIKGYVASDARGATKSITPIIETPMSISVVTRQQMDDQQPQSLNEALRYSAGVVSETEGTASGFWSGSSLQMRGFTPGVFQDGLQDDATGNDLLDPYFYQSIEVLGGPVSVLYGEASPGGIVNVTSKLPTETPLHQLTFGLGNYDRFQGGFDFSGPINGNPHWLYRVTAVADSQNTQTAWIEHRHFGIGPSITWKPDDKTSLTLLSNYTYSPAVGDYSYVPAMGTVLYDPKGKVSSSFSSGDPNFNRASQRLLELGYIFRRQLSDVWAFSQNARYTDNRNMAKMVWPESVASDDVTLSRYAFVRQESSRSYLVDNRLSADFATGAVQHDMLMGVQYSKIDESWAWGDSFDVPTINILNPVYGLSFPALTSLAMTHEWVGAKETGVYFQDQMSIDHWHVVLGVRQDWVNETSTGSEASLDVPTQSSHALSWRVGTTYHLDNGLAPYVSYSTSFQPQFNDITANGSLAVPTTGKQYEAGLKYQPGSGNNLLTLAVYNLTEQNVVESDPNNPNFVIQAGEVRSRGIEFSDHSNITPYFSLIASYAFTDSRYTRNNSTATAVSGATVDIQGNDQEAVPRNAASVWADYTFHDGGLDGFSLSGGVRYIGATYGDQANSFRVPPATVFDAALRYDMAHLNPALHGLVVKFNVANLFDKSYIASCYSTSECNFAVRRNLYASASYDW